MKKTLPAALIGAIFANTSLDGADEDQRFFHVTTW